MIANGGTEDEASRGTLRVALADKLDNARAILADHRRIGDALWSRFNARKTDQLWYLESLAQIFVDRGAQGPLSDEFRATVQALRLRL